MEELQKNYKDARNGLLTSYRMYKRLKKEEPKTKITFEDVKKFIEKQPVSQITRPPPRIENLKIIGEPNSFQIDIIYMKDYTYKGIDKLLVFIDINSRKAWIYILKTKKLDEIFENFEEFLEDINEPIALIMGDNEFNKRDILTLAENYNISTNFVVSKDEHISKQSNVLGIIDRFARTFCSLILKYILANNTLDWVSVLPKLVQNYNSTPHRSLEYLTPNEVYKSKEIQMKFVKKGLAHNREIKEKQQLKVGDRVRVLKGKSKFDKEKENFTKGFYVIVDKENNRYRIADKETKHINQKLYKYDELLKISEVQEAPSETDTSPEIMKEIEKLKRHRNIEKRLRREGINPENIIKK
jgi:hypothetical protein